MSNLSKLRAEIQKITGRLPTSKDETYLSNRLRQLRSQAGKTQHVIVSVSMPSTVRAALERIVEASHGGASAIMREGLAMFAEANGFVDDARIIREAAS